MAFWSRKPRKIEDAEFIISVKDLRRLLEMAVKASKKGYMTSEIVDAAIDSVKKHI